MRDPLLLPQPEQAFALAAQAALLNGRHKTVADIARQEQVTEGYVSQILPLAFLSPTIVQGIVNGSQPVTLTAKSLIAARELPLEWPLQEACLGMC